ncbi:hypothetical protein WCLP8_1810001 [uncultured Gammaproteobacteria bacterium]
MGPMALLGDWQIFDGLSLVSTALANVVSTDDILPPGVRGHDQLFRQFEQRCVGQIDKVFANITVKNREHQRRINNQRGLSCICWWWVLMPMPTPH